MMSKRQVTLADGRYLIFFTFDEEEAPAAEASERRREPRPQVEAGEERGV